MAAHSGPYKTQDPNKSDEVIDVEAALAYLKLRRGEHPDDICKELGLSRRTFYRRIETLIMARERPGRRLLQAMEYDNLQDLTRLVHERLNEEEASNADFVKLVGESRQLSNSRRALMKLDDAEVADETLEDVDELDEWVAEEAEANELELREVRGA